LGLGRPHEALALYRNLVKLHPDVVSQHNNISQVLQGLDRHNEGVNAFCQAFPLDNSIDKLALFLMPSLMCQCAWDDLCAVKQRMLRETSRRLREGKHITV